MIRTSDHLDLDRFRTTSTVSVERAVRGRKVFRARGFREFALCSDGIFGYAILITAGLLCDVDF